MTQRTLRIPLAALLAAASLLPGATAAESAWPSRVVTIVSPYNPGGSNDIPARILAEGFQKIFGQPFIVRNLPGAAGIVGGRDVMNAAPDGYTLLLSNSAAMVVQPVVKVPKPYDPLTHFTPIVKVADAYAFIGVSSSLPVQSVADLIALAKKEPGKLNYTSAGVGSAGHFVGEYFKTLTGTDIMHVPAKGSAAGVIDLKAGHVQLMFDALVVPQSTDGRIKVLSVVARDRVAELPDIPTTKEAGGPDMEVTGWFGLFGPANLPPEIASKLAAAAEQVMANPEVRKTFISASLTPHVQTGEAFRQSLARDLALYTEIKTQANLVVE